MTRRQVRPQRQGPKRAVLYARVSTEEQAKEGTVSIPDQLVACGMHAERKKYEIVGEYREPGFTGMAEKRPEWDRLMAAARAGEFEVVVCLTMSRYARDDRVGLNLDHELAKLGVSVEVCDADFDPNTDSGSAMRSMMLVFAAYQRRALLRTMANGAHGKARDGRWPSSPQGAPFGYRVGKTGDDERTRRRSARLEINEVEAATIRKAAELILDEGMLARDACGVLNSLGMYPRGSLRKQDGVTTHVPAVWSAHLLRHHLTREALTGLVYWGCGRFATRKPDGDLKYGGGVQVAGVPPILSEERFRALGEALQEHGPVHVPGLVYTLSGRIASLCGRTYTGIYRSDRELRSYRCQGKRGSPTCDCPWYDSDWIEQEVWRQVAARLADPEWLAELAREYLAIGAGRAVSQAEELQDIREQIARRESRLQADVAAYLRAGVDASVVEQAARQLQDELAVLRRRREDMERVMHDTAAQAGALDQAAQQARRTMGRLDSFSPEQQAGVIRQLDLRVQPAGPGRRPALEIRGVIPLGGSELLPGESCSLPDVDRSSIEA